MRFLYPTIIEVHQKKTVERSAHCSAPRNTILLNLIIFLISFATKSKFQSGRSSSGLYQREQTSRGEGSNHLNYYLLLLDRQQEEMTQEDSFKGAAIQTIFYHMYLMRKDLEQEGHHETAR